jgi:membrane-bound metal-dependent hydrolase YbcI (DUF457 family)
MPLPLGHAVIGLTIHDLLAREESALQKWKVGCYTAILANLPDVDVLLGLILAGNGNAFHRGPTHSILFALVMALLICGASKLYAPIPKVSFTLSFLIILSHVVADLLFTPSSVSLLWPLETNWSIGYSGWVDVISTALLEHEQDLGIITVCGWLIIMKQLVKNSSDKPSGLPARWKFF